MSESYDVFLSYNSRDASQVSAIAERLRAQGLRPFLDRWYLVPGQPWIPELEKTLAQCKSVAVCIGPYGMGPWQQREIYAALDRQTQTPGFPVIPVLLPGAEPVLGFLSQSTWVDLRAGVADELGLALLQSAIRGQPLGLEMRGRLQAVRDAVCPYRGLLYFREEDAAFFFGRDAAIRQIVQAVETTSFLAVVGASGSGKSSVVRAGLVPALRRSHHPVWEIATLVPGDQPLKSLAAALVPLIFPELDVIDRAEKVNKLAERFADGSVALRDMVGEALARQSGTDRLLLVADQWEELYTLTKDEAAQRRFMDQLLDATVHAPLTLVLTLRGDFVGRALAYRPLSDRLQGSQVNLGPMTGEELDQAIHRPAEKVGLSFEPGLVQRIRSDAGDEPGNLPLLEFVLKELWQNRRGLTLLNQAYDDMDRLAGAIAKRAERFFLSLSPPEQAAVQNLFLQLVRPGDQGQETRRREPLAGVPESSHQLVERLSGGGSKDLRQEPERLLVTARASAGGEETVEIAHEALIQNWKRLRDWLNADREFRLWRERLRGAREEWERADKSEELLLRGPQLAEAERWQRERGSRLSAQEVEFLGSSLKAREQRRTEERERHAKELAQAQALAQEQTARLETQQRGTRRLRIATGIVTLTAAALVFFMLNAQRQKAAAVTATNAAKAARKAGLARQLAAQGLVLADSRYDLALLLGAHAVQLDSSPDVRSSLWRLLQKPPVPVQFVWGQDLPVNRVGFSPDGRWLAAAGGDGTVRLWDATDWSKPGRTILTNIDEFRCLAFTADGSLLAAAGGRDSELVKKGTDRRIFLYDMTKMQSVPKPLEFHTNSVYSLSFSPDGKRLASASNDGMVVLWDLARMSPEETVTNFAGEDIRLRFTSNDELLVLHKGSIDRYDLADQPHSLKSLPEGQSGSADFGDMAVSGDGGTVAAVSSDKVTVWDLTGDKIKQDSSVGLGGETPRIALNSDGGLFAMSQGNAIALWDTGGPQRRPELLQGHGAGIASLAFHPTNDWLVSASRDGSVAVWDLTGRRALREIARLGERPIIRLAFSPDGKVLAVPSEKGIQFIDLKRMEELDGGPLEPGSLFGLAYSPDGTRIATSGGDEEAQIQIWDVSSRKAALAPLQAHKGSVMGVAFSPDGHKLVSGGQDGAVFLWDLQATPPKPSRIMNHEGVVLDVAFSPDGRWIASASGDRTVGFYDLQTQRLLPALSVRHLDSVLRVAFSRDSTLLASASDDASIGLWTLQPAPAFLRSLRGYNFYVAGVSFSPDGKQLASGGADGAVQLWDLNSGSQFSEPLRGHTNIVWSVAFAPDGRTLVSGDDAGWLIFWDLDLDHWTKLARQVANRELSSQEIKDYFADYPFEPLAPQTR